MTISWGSARNGVRVGVQWRPPASPSPPGGQTCYADIYIDRAVNITDTTNVLSWSGSASGSASNLNLSGSGQKHIHTVAVPGAIGGTLDLNVSLANVDYAGGTLTASQSLWVPYGKPPAVSGASATRVSDSRADLSWGGGPPGNSPWLSFSADRRTDGGGYVGVLGGLAGSARSWSDASLSANRKYEWMIYAWNSAAASDGVRVGPIYTTPTAPTTPTWTKISAGDVVVSWTNRAPWASKVWVEESTDGGTSWTKVSSDLSASVTSWTHATPSTATTHRYRVGVATPNGLTARSGASTTVVLLSAPSKPTLVGPTSTQAADEATVLTWQHNAVDGTPQSAYSLRHRANSSAAWTTIAKTSSSTSSHTLAASVYTSGQPEWQVQTWGQHADPSPWMDVASFLVAARPVAGFTTPGTSGVWTAASITVAGTYHDPGGYAQAAWRLKVWSEVSGERSFSGGAGSIEGAVAGLVGGVTYSVTLDVRSSSGLWSQPATRSFTVDFIEPEVPTVTVTYDPDRASALVQISNPDFSEPVVRNEVWCDGVLIGDTDPNGALTVPLPRLDGTSQVIVRAITATGARSDSQPIPVPITGPIGIHLNAGPGFSLHSAMWDGSPKVGWEQMGGVAAQVWEGDTAPSPTWGAEDYLVVKLSGRVRFDDVESNRDAWRQVVRSKSPVCYRDGIRHLFGYLSGLSMSEEYVGRAQMSVTFTESESDPGDLLALLP